MPRASLYTCVTPAWALPASPGRERAPSAGRACPGAPSGAVLSPRRPCQSSPRRQPRPQRLREGLSARPGGVPPVPPAPPPAPRRRRSRGSAPRAPRSRRHCDAAGLRRGGGRRRGAARRVSAAPGSAPPGGRWPVEGPGRSAERGAAGAGPLPERCLHRRGVAGGGSREAAPGSFPRLHHPAAAVKLPRPSGAEGRGEARRSGAGGRLCCRRQRCLPGATGGDAETGLGSPAATRWRGGLADSAGGARCGCGLLSSGLSAGGAGPGVPGGRARSGAGAASSGPRQPAPGKCFPHEITAERGGFYWG